MIEPIMPPPVESPSRPAEESANHRANAMPTMISTIRPNPLDRQAEAGQFGCASPAFTALSRYRSRPPESN